MEDSLVGKKVKIVLKNNTYYKGMVLSQGDTYLKIRDIRDKMVFLNFDSISHMEDLG